jgi:hypothetical protein
MPPSSAIFPEITRDCSGGGDSVGGESELLRFLEYPESDTPHSDIHKNSGKTLLIRFGF